MFIYDCKVEFQAPVLKHCQEILNLWDRQIMSYTYTDQTAFKLACSELAWFAFMDFHFNTFLYIKSLVMK